MTNNPHNGERAAHKTPKRRNEMTKNKIYSDAEYIAQGFKPEEVADARRSDELFNIRDEWTAEEEAEYYRLVKKLGL